MGQKQLLDSEIGKVEKVTTESVFWEVVNTLKTKKNSVGAVEHFIRTIITVVKLCREKGIFQESYNEVIEDIINLVKRYGVYFEKKNKSGKILWEIEISAAVIVGLDLLRNENASMEDIMKTALQVHRARPSQLGEVTES